MRMRCPMCDDGLIYVYKGIDGEVKDKCNICKGTGWIRGEDDGKDKR